MSVAEGEVAERDSGRAGTADQTSSAAASHGSWGYRPGLDGLRAVAVVAVVLYHDGLRSVPGGFLGVDVFFALSGFLITSLLLDEYDRRGGIKLIEFWARRFRRLLPALLFLMVGIGLYVALAENYLLVPSRRTDAPWVLTYLTNWRFIGEHASYFEAFTAPNPFRHLWSLAIEEQLYLIWPPILTLALWLRRGRSDLALAVAGGLAVVSAALMAVLIPALGDPTRSYYGTDTRAQTVLVGAVAAILLRGRTLAGQRRRVVAGLGLVAAAVMLACFALVQDTNLRMYQGGFLLFAVVATMVVVDAAHAGSPVARVLSVRPLRWIGAISYGIYLWHWPIHLWINPQRFDLSYPTIVGLRAVTTVAVAWLSFHLVERPVRRWLEASGGRGDRPRRARSPWLTIGLSAVAIAITVPLFLRGTRMIIGGGKAQMTFRSKELVPAITPAKMDLPAGFGAATPLRLTVVGDSTGFTLAQNGLLRDVQLTNGAVLGCGATTGDYYFGDFLRALPPQCATVQTRWVDTAKTPTDGILVFLGGWEVFDPSVGGKRLAVTSDEWHDWFVGELRTRVQAMIDASPTRVPIGLVELPCPATDTMRVGLGAWERGDPARVAAVNSAVHDVAEAMGKPVQTVSYAGVVCDANGHFLVRDKDGNRPRPDGLHAEGPARVPIWQTLITQLSPDLKPSGTQG